MIKASVDIARKKDPKIIIEGKTTVIVNEALGLVSSILTNIINQQYETKKDALKFVDDIVQDFHKFLTDTICFKSNLS